MNNEVGTRWEFRAYDINGDVRGCGSNVQTALADMEETVGEKLWHSDDHKGIHWYVISYEQAEGENGEWEDTGETDDEDASEDDVDFHLVSGKFGEFDDERDVSKWLVIVWHGSVKHQIHVEVNHAFDNEVSYDAPELLSDDEESALFDLIAEATSPDKSPMSKAAASHASLSVALAAHIADQTKPCVPARKM